MPFHFKKLGVKAGIQIMQGLIALKKALTFLLFIAWQPIRFLGKTLLALGGRSLFLQSIKLAHAMRQKRSIATHPLAVLFIFLLVVTAAYKLVGSHDATSTVVPSVSTDVLEQRNTLNTKDANTPAGSDNYPQALEALPANPTDEQTIPELPTIAGGNALLAPSINTTRLENRLRDAPEEYIVKEGDTLSDIADQFGISVETILWENTLTLRSILKPGSALTILPVSGLSHTVARGETIAKIAKRYNVEERAILDFNEIADGSAVALGQKLIIPEGEQPAAIAPTRPAPRVVRVPSMPSSPQNITPSGIQLLVPVAYRRISQWFTYRHSGIDMAGTYGTPVYAAEDGTVVQAGWGTGYGLYVLIDHGNGLMTRYAHSSKLLVTRGEQVQRGQRIALLGSTGRSTGPHVHFETIVNGRFVNPLRYIKL
ncbi:M23 family metallopeptidase [Candidatus Uhrbacteria bacterium]|nr:M23 family metallopeptidase [Candidatus Uhrbacteria bacterium]